jgi:GntR family transcriptional regulator
VRTLAADLGLAPNTVAKAYRELQSAGYLVGRGRHGTYVADAPPETPARVQAALDEAARTFARRASRLGVPTGAALAAVRRALQSS